MGNRAIMEQQRLQPWKRIYCCVLPSPRYSILLQPQPQPSETSLLKKGSFLTRFQTSLKTPEVFEPWASPKRTPSCPAPPALTGRAEPSAMPDGFWQGARSGDKPARLPPPAVPRALPSPRWEARTHPALLPICCSIGSSSRARDV